MITMKAKMSSNKTIDNKEFGLRLRSLRKEKNMTQAELATKTRVTRSSVANWETGQRFPDIDALKLIAALFNAPVDYLYGISDQRYRVNIPDSFEMDLTKLNDEGMKRMQEYYNMLLKNYPAE